MSWNTTRIQKYKEILRLTEVTTEKTIETRKSVTLFSLFLLYSGLLLKT